MSFHGSIEAVSMGCRCGQCRMFIAQKTMENLKGRTAEVRDIGGGYRLVELPRCDKGAVEHFRQKAKRGF